MTEGLEIVGSTSLEIPRIRTERLVLRAPAAQDLPAWSAFLASNRTVHVGGTKTEAAAFQDFAALIGHWALRGYGRWMIVKRDTDELLGSVGLFFPVGWPEPEIAWTIFEAAEGKGYAFEAAVATRDFAYDTLGMSTLVSCIVPANGRSIALAERMGAAFEGYFEHSEIGQMSVYRHLAPGQRSR